MNQRDKNIFGRIPIEKVKTYWDEFPCNLSYSKNQIGTREYFDEVEKQKYLTEPHILKFAEFEKWRGKKVLEIGCGIGTDTINFAKAGAQVTATDISEQSLNIARQRAKVYGLDNKIKFYCGNAEELSKFIPLEPYDLIYSFGVIHHTPHPDKVIKEVHKYTNSGTMIKIMVYHRFSWPVFWILLKGKGEFWKLDELIAKYSESQNCPITYTFSKKEVRNLLKGFNILNISIEHGISAANRLRKIRDNGFIYPILHFFEKPFGWHILINAIAP